MLMRTLKKKGVEKVKKVSEKLYEKLFDAYTARTDHFLLEFMSVTLNLVRSVSFVMNMLSGSPISRRSV